jgi:cold shock protein
MQKGIVKWFNNAKGYGFLLAEESSKDVFVHFSSITMDGFRTLRTGQSVMFEAIEGPKGLHATAIEIISTPDFPHPGSTTDHKS